MRLASNKHRKPLLMLLRLALRLLWRDWRGGELRLLVAALVMAVTSVTGIALFTDRLEQALLLESANVLAADRVLGSGQQPPRTILAEARRRGLHTAETLSFTSMVFSDSGSMLVAAKAVSDHYPLRGELIVTDVPYTRGRPVRTGPPPGEVWLETRILLESALNVAVGDSVYVGEAELKVGQILIAEPDRQQGGMANNFGPRLMLNLADVARTKVVQAGSRVSYRYLFAAGTYRADRSRESAPNMPHNGAASTRAGMAGNTANNAGSAPNNRSTSDTSTHNNVSDDPAGNTANNAPGVTTAAGSAALAAFEDWIATEFNNQYRVRDVREESEEIAEALTTAESFLLLGSLFAVLLAGVTIALTARRYSERHYDYVAILKTLGCTSGQVAIIYSFIQLVLVTLATVLGWVLGWLVHQGILLMLQALLTVALPPAGWQPYVVGALTAIICLLAFALPPLLALRGHAAPAGPAQRFGAATP